MQRSATSGTSKPSLCSVRIGLAGPGCSRRDDTNPDLASASSAASMRPGSRGRFGSAFLESVHVNSSDDRARGAATPSPRHVRSMQARTCGPLEPQRPGQMMAIAYGMVILAVHEPDQLTRTRSHGSRASPYGRRFPEKSRASASWRSGLSGPARDWLPRHCVRQLPNSFYAGSK